MISARNISLLTSLFTTLGILNAPSWAQESLTTTAPEELAELDFTSVMRIDVTAQKRKESLWDVPIPITALNSAEIERRGIERIADFVTQAPGLQYGEIYGLGTVFVRGVGLNEPSGATAPGVAFYVDGVYQPHAAEAALPFTDLERIEFLRGPQGTLYGRNATGGVFKMLTQEPAAGWASELNASYGSFGQFKTRGMLNIPVSETVQTRLSMAYGHQQAGLLENVAGGPDLGASTSLSGRWKVLIALQGGADLELSLHGLDGEETLYNAFFAQIPPGFFGAGVQAIGSRRTAADSDGKLDRQLQGANVRIRAPLGPVNIVSLSSYQKFDYDIRELDADSTNARYLTTNSQQHIETYLQQFDASGDLARLSWLAGLSFMRDVYESIIKVGYPSGTAIIPGFFEIAPGGSFVADVENRTRSNAAYLDLTFAATDQLDLIAGARYTDEQVHVTQTLGVERFSAPAFGLLLPFVATCEDLQLQPQFQATTFRGGAQYKARPNLHFYSIASRGFKSGGANGGQCDNQFNPEQVTSYEAGLKSEFLGGKLYFNTSLFHYDYRDMQLFAFSSSGSTIINVSQAHLDGAEIEALMQLTGHWALSTNATWLRSRYGDFENRDILSPALGVQQLRGNRLNYSPPYSANLALQYSTANLPIGRFSARLESQLNGQTYFRPFNAEEDAQPAYDVQNLSLIWDSHDNLRRVRAFVHNLFDEAYIATLSASAAGRFGTYGMPRQVGVEVIAKF